MRLAELLGPLDTVAPLGGAQSWDNTGLIAGDEQRVIQRILVTNDTTSQVVAEAAERGAELIVSYHPPFLKGPQKFAPDAPLIMAIRRDIAIYSPHTAWDVAQGGVNDFLADVVGLSALGRAPLEDGVGRFGVLDGPHALLALVERMKRGCRQAFGLLAAPSPHAQVGRVAVAAGAGDGLLDAALSHRAELFVTGELRHHAILRAIAAGCAVLCLTHSGSERASLGRFREQLVAVLEQRGFRAPEVHLSQIDHDPLGLV